MTDKDYKALATIARKFRDGFTYDPGHSDLDNEQPIHVRVTLGDWRLLNFVLREQEGSDGERGIHDDQQGSSGPALDRSDHASALVPVLDGP